METNKKRRCYNCKHRSGSFKIGKLTHYHCFNKELYPEEPIAWTPSAWETLRVFSDVCDKHEFKP